jgi:uncharacterized membrane protein
MTPSLLPRPTLFEGIIAGLGAALGYAIGTSVSALIRRTGIPEPSRHFKHIAWGALAVAGPLLGIWALVQGVYWQNDVRSLVQVEPEPISAAITFGVIGIITFLAVIVIARGLRKSSRAIGNIFDRFLPTWLARILGTGAVALFAFWLLSGVLTQVFVNVANAVYANSNAGTAPGITQPTSELRSGSSASQIPWQTLGAEGRNFVARGPSVTQLTDFSGRPAMEPIRIYSGLDSAPTAHERAALAVKELERTGAFNRKVLVVAGTTGTGWLEPQSVDSLEYVWNGDTAIVAQQYSYLPSWISTLVDVQRASDAGTELFTAVYNRWSQLPADHRPKLLAYGLSLGSFSMQSGFGGASDLVTRTDGALFVGSPNFSQPFEDLRRNRDQGSPEWKPVYKNGADVRFGAIADDLNQPNVPWAHPRIVYLQHASDPVVWWTPTILFSEPDWLAEEPGTDRTANMRWFPVVTLLQVTVDQFVGVNVPNGHGHNYGPSIPAVWDAILHNPDWTEADTARLSALITNYDIE